MKPNSTSLPQQFSVIRRLVEPSVSFFHTLRKYPVYSRGIVEFIPYDDILYCTAQSNYTEITRCDGHKILVCKCLKLIVEEINDPVFIRVHASHLVNFKYVDSISFNKNSFLKIKEHEIPVSRTYSSNIKKLF